MVIFLGIELSIDYITINLRSLFTIEKNLNPIDRETNLNKLYNSNTTIIDQVTMSSEPIFEY